MQTQTIIYHKPTGRILTTLNSKYIRHRRDLIQYAESLPLGDIAFFYEPEPIDISTAEDRIKQIAHGSPPVVVSPSGEVKSFTAWSAHRRKQISSAHDILWRFEGGMGDQVLQAEAALEFFEVYKEKSLTITVKPSFFETVKNIIGLDSIHPQNQAFPRAQFQVTIEGAPPYISDPRGHLYGKACLYGATLGLNYVRKKATFKPLPDHAAIAFKRLGVNPEQNTRPKIGIHIRSGSGNAKSWKTDPAQKVAQRFITDQDAIAFLIGYQGDWQIQNPSAFRVDGSFPWVQTAAIIQALDILIAVDSGPMHLARALNTPHLILWGGTTPRDILGREPEPHDFRLPLPCIDDICYDCPQHTTRCMNLIDPDDVYTRAMEVIKHAPSKDRPRHQATDHQTAGLTNPT